MYIRVQDQHARAFFEGQFREALATFGVPSAIQKTSRAFGTIVVDIPEDKLDLVSSTIQGDGRRFLRTERTEERYPLGESKTHCSHPDPMQHQNSHKAPSRCHAVAERAA